MATKAQIQAAIQAQLTGNAGLTTHAQHEEFLHTETDSILENIYPTPVSDTQADETYTTSNANYDYEITITKTGRKVHITGYFLANATQSIASTVFAISEAEFQQLSGATFRGQGVFQPSGDTATLGILSNNFILNNAIVSGETVTFEITYEVNA